MIPVRSRNSNAYDRLWTTCMARLPGVGTDSLAVEIGNAMQEFARTTHVWRETVKVNLINGTPRYNIAPRSSGCANISYLISVTVEDRVYAPVSPDGPPTNPYSVYSWEPSCSTIQLFPTPTKDVPKGLHVVMGLALKDTSLDLPDDIIAHHFEHLLDGVLERAYAHHAKPYSDSNKAQYHHRRFRAAITQTRRIIRGGNAQASPSWAFPTQAPGRPKRGARSYGW